MEQLKDYDIMDIEAIDDERIKASSNALIVPATRVYIKSEADKVIAELQNESDVYKAKYEQEYDIAVHNEKQLSAMRIELRRHKRKRCLAMAEICCEKKENCYNRALRKYTKDEADYLVCKSDFWQDWEFRWLKIAEKFKE